MSVRNLTIYAAAVAAAFVTLFLFLVLYYQKGLGDYADLSDSVSRLGLSLNRMVLLLDRANPRKELAEEIKRTDGLFNSLQKGLSSSWIPRDRDPALAAAISRTSAEWKDIRSRLKEDEGGGAEGVKIGLLSLSGEVLSLSPLIKEDTFVFTGWHTKAFVIFSISAIGAIWYAALFVIWRILAPIEEVTKKVADANSPLPLDTETRTGAPYREIRALIDRYERLSGSLNESLTHYRDLMDTIPDALVETDEHGNITFVNEAAKALTGYSGNDLIGRDHTGFIFGGAAAEMREIFDAVMRGETLKNRELPIILKDGSTRYFEFSSSPIKASGRGEEVVGCRFVGRDVDERRRMMDELKETKKKSEEASGKLKRTIEDLEEFALLAVRREHKMHEIRERLKSLVEERRG